MRQTASADVSGEDASPTSGCREVGTSASIPALLRSIERACVKVDAVLEQVRRATWAPPAPGRDASPPSRASSRTPRVLVLSADPRARRSAVMELLAVGLEVDWARDVEEARFRAACSRPDAVVVESYPAPSRALGTLVAQLAAFQETAPVPVIVRSGDVLPPRVRERCVAVVRGPGAGEIVALVRELASARAGRRAGR